MRIVFISSPPDIIIQVYYNADFIFFQAKLCKRIYSPQGDMGKFSKSQKVAGNIPPGGFPEGDGLCIMQAAFNTKGKE